MGYYDYQELLSKAMKGNQSDVNALGNWFEQYGQGFWNGEYYKIDSNSNLYPIYKQIDKDNAEIIGYEIR